MVGTGECKDDFRFTRRDSCPGVGRYKYTCSHPNYEEPSAAEEGAIAGSVVGVLFCGGLIFGIVFFKNKNGNGSKVSDNEELAKLREQMETYKK